MESNTKEYLKQIMDEMPVGVFLDICKGIQAYQARVHDMRLNHLEQALQRSQQALDYSAQATRDSEIAADLRREAGEELAKTNSLILGLEVDHPTPEDLAKPLSQVAAIDTDHAVKCVGYMLGLVG